MLFKKHYIILFLSALLLGNVSAKEHSKPEIKSFAKSAQVSNIVIISGENITLNNNEVYNVLKNGNTAKIKKTNDRVKIQADKKIVFKPGTKIKAEKGKSFHAVVVKATPKSKTDELIADRYKFFKQNNNKKESGGLSKESDSGSIGLGSWNALAVVVDNQQRRISGSTNIVDHNSLKGSTSINNNNNTESFSFVPETIKVLRL